jgi:hypothetical protein
MAMYPMWITIKYKEFDRSIGYTGCVNTRRDLLDAFIRLEISKPNTLSILLNGVVQNQTVIDLLFTEIESVKEEGETEYETGKATNKKAKK